MENNNKNNEYKILITCPPMIGMIDHFRDKFRQYNAEIHSPHVVQELSEDELIKLVPEYDGWIIGDDPATYDVLNTGKKGRLRAVIKWGVGTDNIDQAALNELQIAFSNTPAMFGDEVADIVISYIVGLARHTYRIDREVRQGKWPKYPGVSLRGKQAGLVGYGDIGRQTVKRLSATGMSIVIFDPAFSTVSGIKGVEISAWPDGIERCDFIILTCSLNKGNKNMINKDILKRCKDGVMIINVSRGGLINETDLIRALETGKVESVALDVMENEPLPADSGLRKYENCIFGSHNASNTIEAVQRTSIVAIDKLFSLLNK